MYHADLYLRSVIAPTTFAVKSFSLTDRVASQLALALGADAVDNYYSAAVSIGDAISGINRQFFSWATVKLYYSVFYALRSLLALDGHCLFHVGTKPKWIRATPGAQPIPAAKSTHLTVLNYFEKNYPSHLLISQPIGTDSALRWLYDKRVEANYTNDGFGEPDIPEHLERIMSIGVRLAVEAYLSDSGNSYLFDADHAILALPLKALHHARQKLTRNGRDITAERTHFLNTVAFRDRLGPISSLHALLK